MTTSSGPKSTKRQRADALKAYRASYDPRYGYPTRISVRCNGNAVDCGGLTEARNLQPLP